MPIRRGNKSLRRVKSGKTFLYATDPQPNPTPGHDELERRASLTVAHLRVGCSPDTGDTRLRLGQSDTDACPDFGDKDSIMHLLLDCPAYQGPRSRRWGPLPRLEDAFSADAQQIWTFLVDAGRVPRDPA